ncbi:MAG: hypothetical protein IT538_09125 [Variibacter sp.]|nr:hypothetical protein [Variibacter sp.]
MTLPDTMPACPMGTGPVTTGRRSLLLGAAMAAAATQASARGSAEQITVAQSSDVLTLDPSQDTSPISLNAFKNIFDQLTDIAADGSVAPQLATAWEASPDNTVWTFTLRTDAKFHDGKPVTAADVAWSYTKIMADGRSPVRTFVGAIKEVEVVAPDKVRFTLKSSFAPFHRQVSLISVLPRAAYEAMGAARFSQQPIGSGPFKVVRWVKDDRLVLDANAEYWGQVPRIKQVVFRPVPAEPARAAGLLSGELDVVALLPPPMIRRLQTARDVRVQTVASNRVLYLGFDVNTPPLNNVKLRQAIDCAINREAITGRLLQGLGKPEGQVVAPVTFGYDPTIQPTAYDPARARQLLRESGYAGERVRFQFPNNRYAMGSEIAQAVGGFLREVGINVELEGMEYSAFFPLWTGRRLNAMHMFAFGPSIMDAELAMNSLYEAGSRAYWQLPEIDALVKRQRGETDPERRKAIISQIFRRSQQEAVYAVLHHEVQAYGIANGLQWSPRPDERLVFGTATFGATR